MAVIFPELITLGPQGGFLQLTQSIPSEISAQVVSSVGEYRRLVLQGRFNEDDDFSAILKTIAALEEHVEVNSGEAQLQSSSQASLHWLIDPFGYHFVGCKVGANAIRLHDEVVAVVARLFRSLRLDVIVEPG